MNLFTFNYFIVLCSSYSIVWFYFTGMVLFNFMILFYWHWYIPLLHLCLTCMDWFTSILAHREKYLNNKIIKWLDDSIIKHYRQYHRIFIYYNKTITGFFMIRNTIACFYIITNTIAWFFIIKRMVLFHNKCYRMVLLLPTGKNSRHSQVAVRRRQAHCHLWPCREFFSPYHLFCTWWYFIFYVYGSNNNLCLM